MRKWYGSVVTASLFMLLVLRYFVKINPVGQSYLTGSFSLNATNPLEWVSSVIQPDVLNPRNSTQAIFADGLTSSLFVPRNMTKEEKHTLLTWNHLKHLINHSTALPNALDATKEAANAWSVLMNSIEGRGYGGNDSMMGRSEVKQCPHYINKINATGRLAEGAFRLIIPCGLTQGSSITIIGIPHGLLGSFRIELTGEQIPGEPEPPILFHYNVRLRGDKVTVDPVIVQNTWTVAHGWGEEERCPSPSPEKNKKVDELDQCNDMVGRDTNLTSRGGVEPKELKSSSLVHQTKQYFPFKMGYPFVATLRVGSEGIQMTVDGKHITSFAFRENLDPWLVNEAKISGDLELVSVLASSLPTLEDLDHVIDLEALKSPPISLYKPLDLVIGVFSTANNFKRRMAVRRTWMQYPMVRSGAVAVRFFVGLHKNQRVNKELWKEAQAYGDIQLMPFVDYYSLITWKTLAICTFGTEVVSAKYIMKTDDDAFIRVDEILDTLINRIKVSRGLLYGLINKDSQPHRSTDSKWYITPEEWPEEKYPPWAHGPGYVVSHDIAKEVSERQREGRLKMFRLEDVAMGMWIDAMKKDGLRVRYESELRVYNEGCKDGYVVAHYQGPSQMLCLWRKLKQANRAVCCGD